MKVYCSNLKCKYMNDKNICTAKTIVLSLNGIHTTNQGYQDFLKCKTYKISSEYEELQNKVNELLGDTNVKD